MPSFTDPQVVPNLYLKNVKLLMDHIDFQSIFFFLKQKLMASVKCLVNNILYNIFVCVQLKKETHSGLELEVE